MKIKDILDLSTGQAVTFKAVISDKKIQVGVNKSEYLNITFSDSTGFISTPIFENIKKIDIDAEIGEAYSVTAVINKWNNNTQLKSVWLTKLNESEYTSDDFIDSYTINGDNLGDFVSIVNTTNGVYSKAIKIALFDNEIGLYSKFIKAPAAEKHHGNKLGGLFLHTYGMIKLFENIITIYEELDPYTGSIKTSINRDRMILKIILHDIMKVNEYEYETFIKRKNVVGHIIDGCSFLEKINEKLDEKFTEEELDDIKYSILSHHGQYGSFEPKTIEDEILHMLDMIDSRIVGAVENGK